MFTLPAKLDEPGTALTHGVCLTAGHVPGAFILQPCPGQSPEPVCTPGTSLLSAGAQLYDNFETYAAGCCACRATKSTGTTTVYGGTHFTVDCSNGLTPAPLAPNTVVHYTGMLLQGHEDNGCPKNDYAEVVLVSPQDSKHHTFWVQASDLASCDSSRSCTPTRVELGASCDTKACCTMAAEGGNPGAVCYKPEASYPRTCAVAPAPGALTPRAAQHPHRQSHHEAPPLCLHGKQTSKCRVSSSKASIRTDGFAPAMDKALVFVDTVTGRINKLTAVFAR